MNTELTSETPAAFSTWNFKGVEFIAIPSDRAFHIMDEQGNNYGAWMDVDGFRKRQRIQNNMAIQPLGKGRLGVWTI
jgi:hypothetical protein